MASNGEVKEESETVEHSEEYNKLIDYGIDPTVAHELDQIYTSGILCHGDLDDRALEALKEFKIEDGIALLKEFRESNLDRVSNKSAFLCGVMKTHRAKLKLQGTAAGGAIEKKPGPDEDKLKAILDRTGYHLDYTTGQRKYGGPPPDWEGPQPGAGHEVFCGKIPKEVFEDELIPLFEKCGKIWDLRLMMEPLTGLNRSYCFVTFVEKEGANEAVKQLDNYEIRPGKRLKVNISVANLRLYIGNIPKSKSKEEIMEEFQKISENLQDVIIYNYPDDPIKWKNRGFTFLEYKTHKDASVAKRRIGNGKTRVWGCDLLVDWADPQEEPNQETMSKVKVLYVRNLKSDVTEEQLKEHFEPHGKVERVKKIRDYGFVHFEDRDNALEAMDALNGSMVGDSKLEISLAKPPSESRQKEKRKREMMKRMMMGNRYDFEYWSPPGRMGPMRGGRGMRPPHGGRGDFEYEYRYPGYDYRGGYAEDYYDYYGGGGGGYEDEFIYGGGYGGRGRSRGGGAPPPPGPPHPPLVPPRGGRGVGVRGMARGGVGAPRGAAGRGSRGGSLGATQQQRGGVSTAGRGGGRGAAAGQTNNRGGPVDHNHQPPDQLAGGYASEWKQEQAGNLMHPAVAAAAAVAAVAASAPQQQHFPTVGEFQPYT